MLVPHRHLIQSKCLLSLLQLLHRLAAYFFVLIIPSHSLLQFYSKGPYTKYVMLRGSGGGGGLCLNNSHIMSQGGRGVTKHCHMTER